MKINNLRIFVDGRDCTDECDFHVNRRSSGFGYSYSDIYIGKVKIGNIHCGTPSLTHGAYSGEIREYEVTQEEWDAAPKDLTEWFKEREPVAVTQVAHEEVRV